MKANCTGLVGDRLLHIRVHVITATVVLYGWKLCECVCVQADFCLMGFSACRTYLPDYSPTNFAVIDLYSLLPPAPRTPTPFSLWCFSCICNIPACILFERWDDKRRRLRPFCFVSWHSPLLPESWDPRREVRWSNIQVRDADGNRRIISKMPIVLCCYWGRMSGKEIRSWHPPAHHPVVHHPAHYRSRDLTDKTRVAET
jgi:hypothetical protein